MSLKIKKYLRWFFICIFALISGFIIHEKYDDTATTFFSSLIIVILCETVRADIKNYIIPNKFLLIMLFLGAFRILFGGQIIYAFIYSSVSFILVALVVCVVKLLFKKTALRIGDGDYKLIAVFSFCFGMECLLYGLIISAFVTIVYSALLYLLKKKPKKIPAAPIFAVGILTSFFLI